MISLENAILLALKAHEGQTDKAGNPAIFHPLMVLLLAKNLSNDLRSHILAILHDAVEDTGDTSIYDKLDDRDLESALRAITRRKNEPYKQYLMRLSHNSLARKVKLLDLVHNISRGVGKPEFASLVEEYQDALQYLNNQPLQIRSTEYFHDNSSHVSFQQVDQDRR